MPTPFAVACGILAAMAQSTSSKAVRLGGGGLLLGRGGETRELPLLSGAMHFFRLPRDHWGRALDAFAALDLPLVDSYVPWAVHERSAGSFDFDRGGDGHTDLGGFLDACRERGLHVILRPGPHINAELTGFGFPQRILRDPRCQAIGALGNPVVLPVPPRFFSVPSYASERFLEQADAWLAAFARFVTPYQWPAGPVVAVQVDNELSLFFRAAAYDQDYHPDAIGLYRDFLARRYEGRLPAGYRGAEPSALDPPRRFDAERPEELVPHLDWVAFKEELLLGALRRLGGTLRAAGLTDVLLTHNFIGVGGADCCTIAEVEREVDLAGLDLYLPRRDYRAARRAAQLACGSTRLPTLTEIGWGGWPWWLPQAAEDQLSTVVTTLMHGVKGFNLYMTVERDRWYGAPIGPDGEPREERYEATRSLIAAVRSTELAKLRRRVDVGLLLVRDYHRLSLCTSLLDPLPPLPLALLGVGPNEWASDDSCGLSEAIQRAHQRVLDQLAEQLDELAIPYHLVDSEVEAALLCRYRLLIVPMFDFVDPALLSRLATFVGDGGRLLLVPRRPQLDRTLRPLQQEVPEHTLCSIEGAGELVEQLADAGEVAHGPVCDNDAVELSRFEGDDEVVLFAANRAETSCTAALRALDPRARVCDALTGAPVNAGCLHLDGNQVRMLRISTPDAGNRRRGSR